MLNEGVASMSSLTRVAPLATKAFEVLVSIAEMYGIV